MILGGRKSIEAHRTALLDAQNALAASLLAQAWSPTAERHAALTAEIVQRPRHRGDITETHYQTLHDTRSSYQKNNWLTDQAERILANAPRSIAELGCGNAQFVRRIAPRVERAFAVDWARSPRLGALPDNVSFVEANLLTDALPEADVICSGDVLEHFDPDELAMLLPKMQAAAARQYHVIACFDDRISHLTVMPPGAWLALFKALDPAFRLVEVGIRRQKSERVVCTITNMPANP